MTAPPAPAPPLLELRGIAKRFGGVRALDGVDFDLRAGEIHALLGENGAGKSTLIRILGGLHRPDAGEIRLDGVAVAIPSAARAADAGIRIVHQELALVPGLSIAENLLLGREPRRFGTIDRRAMDAAAEAHLADLGFGDLGDVRQPAGGLSVARRQLVEIARAFVGRVRLLVLDEPTASLSEAETARLFDRLRSLRRQGVGMIYISHRLDEIRRLADRVTVLRDGRSIGTRNVAEVDTGELVAWMVGRTPTDHYPRPSGRPGNVALEVRNLRAPGVNGATFRLREGEILGLAGLVGAGRTELARALAGLAQVTSGEILLDSRPVRFRSPAAARAAGVVLVPEDRRKEGLILTGSPGFNLALPWTHLWFRGGLPRPARRDAIVARAVDAFDIRFGSPHAAAATLSGGNQQKIAIAKWMEIPPKVLILDEPTRGVDVGAREEIFALLGELLERRLAILLISSDLPEVMNLSHRLALYRDGAILCDGPSDAFTPERAMGILTGALPAPGNSLP